MKKISVALSVILLALLSTPMFGQKAVLNEDEKSEALFMLEEEKMARDVYLVLDEQWNQTVFENISASETRHYSMMKQIALDNNLVIPKSVSSDIKGEFQNKDLQKMYDELIATGKKSLVDALKVGAKIEELDIKDLDEALAATDNKALVDVYTRLQQASEKHLRSFTNNLSKQGLAYEPVILNQKQYDDILKARGNKASCCAGKAGKSACKENQAKSSCKGEKGNSKKACCSGKEKGKGCGKVQ